MGFIKPNNNSGGSGGGLTPQELSRLNNAYTHSKSEHAPTTAEQNVQPDWNETDTTSDAYIKNKPDLSQIGSGGGIPSVTQIEPQELDMPKVFFYGATLPTSKTDVNLTMDYISNTTKFSSYIKLKCQGNSSMSYAKKNFTINMYSDEARETKLKKDFKGWGAQSKFCLKANYVDTTHTRNISGARIGYDMVASRPDSAFKQQLLTAPRYGLVDGFPIKLYFNGEFYGIYTWNIPKDGWMFNMDKSNPNHIVLCAERNTDGNSSAINSCQFRQLWDGGGDWSYEFGTPSDAIKNSLNRCISFVMDATDQEFHDNIGQYFDLYSLLDYYCFSYLACHLDGLAKNLLMVTYDGVIWGASLYDMDSIYGVEYTGNSYVATNYQCPEQYQEQFSRLWVRIEQCFATELYTRYLELRQGALSLGNIIKHVEEIYDVIPDRVFADEKAKWTNLPQVNTNTMTRFRNYMRDRAVYVDAQMLEIGTKVPCTGIVLSADTLSFTTTDTQTLSVVVSPENCTDTVAWSVSPTGVVSVDNGVVTPIANGTCTITVTCGAYSDTCTVNVALPVVECTGISLDKSELTLGKIESSGADTSTNLLSGLQWTQGRIKDDGTIVSGNDMCTQMTIEVPGQYTLALSGGYTYSRVVGGHTSAKAYNFSVSNGGNLILNVFNVPASFAISTNANGKEFDANNVSLMKNNHIKDIPRQNDDLTATISSINVKWTDSQYTYVELYASTIYNDIVAVKFNSVNYGVAASSVVYVNNGDMVSKLDAENLTVKKDYAGKSLFYFKLPIAWGSTGEDILAYINSNDIKLILNPTDYINSIPSGSIQTILTAQLTATVTPTNCTQPVVWTVSPEGIVTVDNGLVIAVANGKATVTATCGTQSATCNVNVSGIGESGGGGSTNPNLVFQINSTSMNTTDNTLTDNIAGISATLTGNPTVSGNQIAFTASDKFSFDISSLNLTNSNRTFRIKFTPTILDNNIRNVIAIGSSINWSNMTTSYIKPDSLIIQHGNIGFNNNTVGSVPGNYNQNRLSTAPVSGQEYELVISESTNGNVRWYIDGVLVQNGNCSLFSPLYLGNTEGNARFIGSYSLIEIYNGYCNDYTEFTNMVNSRNV